MAQSQGDSACFPPGSSQNVFFKRCGGQCGDNEGTALGSLPSQFKLCAFEILLLECCFPELCLSFWILLVCFLFLGRLASPLNLQPEWVHSNQRQGPGLRSSFFCCRSVSHRRVGSSQMAQSQNDSKCVQPGSSQEVFFKQCGRQ